MTAHHLGAFIIPPSPDACTVMVSFASGEVRACGAPVTAGDACRQHHPAAYAKPISERCTRHAWREQPLGEPYPDHATYHHCTRCGIDYDEIEAELADEKARADGLNDDCNSQTEKIDDLTERLSQAEFAAKTNSETVAMQQAAIRAIEAAHAKELHGLRDELDRLRKGRAELKAICAEMTTLVVDTRDHGPQTLMTVYEQAKYHRPRCTVCLDPACAPVCEDREP